MHAGYVDAVDHKRTQILPVMPVPGSLVVERRDQRPFKAVEADFQRGLRVIFPDPNINVIVVVGRLLDDNIPQLLRAEIHIPQQEIRLIFIVG